MPAAERSVSGLGACKNRSVQEQAGALTGRCMNCRCKNKSVHEQVGACDTGSHQSSMWPFARTRRTVSQRPKTKNTNLAMARLPARFPARFLASCLLAPTAAACGFVPAAACGHHTHTGLWACGFVPAACGFVPAAACVHHTHRHAQAGHVDGGVTLPSRVTWKWGPLASGATPQTSVSVVASPQHSQEQRPSPCSQGCRTTHPPPVKDELPQSHTQDKSQPSVGVRRRRRALPAAPVKDQGTSPDSQGAKDADELPRSRTRGQAPMVREPRTQTSSLSQGPGDKPQWSGRQGHRRAPSVKDQGTSPDSQGAKDADELPQSRTMGQAPIVREPRTQTSSLSQGHRTSRHRQGHRTSRHSHGTGSDSHGHGTSPGCSLASAASRTASNHRGSTTPHATLAPTALT
eukprot:358044-Chlamydomonas_euryale.AAC.5